MSYFDRFWEYSSYISKKVFQFFLFYIIFFQYLKFILYPPFKKVEPNSIYRLLVIPYPPFKKVESNTLPWLLVIPYPLFKRRRLATPLQRCKRWIYYIFLVLTIIVYQIKKLIYFFYLFTYLLTTIK